MDTFYDWTADRGGVTIGIDVTANAADYCLINASATPASYVGDPVMPRRGFASVSLYCPSDCVVTEALD